MLLNELFTSEKDSTPKYDLIDDMVFYIDNDDELHKEFFIPAVNDLKRKNIIQKDSVEEVAPAFKDLVEVACSKYHETYHPKGKIEDIYTDDFKNSVAMKIAEKHLQHIKDGHYDPKES